MNLILPFFAACPFVMVLVAWLLLLLWCSNGRDKHHEGLMEIAKGLFMVTSIAGLFLFLPPPLLRLCLLWLGLVDHIRQRYPSGEDVISLVVTAVIPLVSYITFGFLGGLAVHYLTHP